MMSDAPDNGEERPLSEEALSLLNTWRKSPRPNLWTVDRCHDRHRFRRREKS